MTRGCDHKFVDSSQCLKCGWKPKLPPNTTRTGAVACAFGTPWLDHFEPPVGTGRGCLWCAGAADEACARAEAMRTTWV